MRIVALLAMTSAAYAQAPAFEVASVKAVPSGAEMRRVGMDGGPGTKDPVRWNAENLSLSNLVNIAYDVPHYRVFGPAWTSDERFIITAKLPSGATKEEFRLMLQALLAERFHLKVHREKREMPVYDLVVAKGGPKLQQSQGEVTPGEFKGMALGKDGYPEFPKGMSVMGIMKGRARMQWIGQTMPEFAVKLSNQLNRPVVDATGIDGKYDFSVFWWAAAPDAENAGPTLEAAVQEQLGLRLESKKAPVEVVVIDEADRKPTEN